MMAKGLPGAFSWVDSKNGPIETAHQQGFRVGERAQPQGRSGQLDFFFKLPLYDSTSRIGWASFSTR